MRSTEAQAPILAAGSAVAFVVGPIFLRMLMPRYVDGLPALQPLLPGAVVLALAWPARQMLITLERAVPLFIATLLGLVCLAVAGTIGADRAGLVGVAWGMSAGYACVAFLTSATSLVPTLGWRCWGVHIARLSATLAWYGAGAIVAAKLPLTTMPGVTALPARCAILAVWTVPALMAWGRRHDWGGLASARGRGGPAC
jgi:O-antigen/teichoic acid export membrane protein